MSMRLYWHFALFCSNGPRNYEGHIHVLISMNDDMLEILDVVLAQDFSLSAISGQCISYARINLFVRSSQFV